MNNFFDNLTKQVNFHHTNSSSEEECFYSVTDSVSDVPDTVLASNAVTFLQTVNDDDYIVIDPEYNEFSSFRRTFSSEAYPDSPPTYRQVSQSDELPSYLSVLSGSCTIISGPAIFSKNNLSPLESEMFPTGNLKSALSDVPFQLHPSLEMKLQTRAIFDNLDLEPLSFDWSKHSHDFRNEKLCLRDMNSDELANIDEFLIPSSDPQSPTILPPGDDEVNLMQF